MPIDLADIYVLRAMVNLRGFRENAYLDSEHAERCLNERDCGLEISLVEAFRQAEMRKQRGIVILGENPGSGKTTHLKRLLLWCIRKGHETVGLPNDMIPVFLPLRELKSLDKGLDAFIQEQLQNPHLQTDKGFGRRLPKGAACACQARLSGICLSVPGVGHGIIAEIQMQTLTGWDGIMETRGCNFIR